MTRAVFHGGAGDQRIETPRPDVRPDVVRRGDVASAETRETLESVSESTPEPSKPRGKSRRAA